MLPARIPNRLPYDQIYMSNNAFFVTVCVQDKICIFGDVGVGGKGGGLNESGKDVRDMEGGKDKLSPTGLVVRQTWVDLPNVFENIVLDKFVVMPNHFHGIIIFLDTPIRKINQKPVNLSQIIGWLKAYSQKQIREKIAVGEGLSLPSPSHNNQSLPSPCNNIIQSGRYKIVPTSPSHIDQSLQFACDDILKSGRYKIQLSVNKSQSGKDKLSPTGFNLHKIWQKSFYDHVIRDEKDMNRIREYILNNPLRWKLDKH
jgi:REP element-mobilizing transposase RayT